MSDEQQTRIRHRKQTFLTSINAFAMNSEQQVKFLQKTAPNLVAVNQLRQENHTNISSIYPE